MTFHKMGRRTLTFAISMTLIASSCLALVIASTHTHTKVVPQCGSCTYSANQAPVACEQIIEIQAGSVVQFVDQEGSAISPRTNGNPVWSADQGYIDQTGTYTAPAAVPVDGLDSVSYTDPVSGTTSLILINVVPNAGAPVGPNAPVYSLVSSQPYTATSSSNSSAQATQSTAVGGSSPTTTDAQEAAGPQTSAVSTGDSPIVLTNVQSISATTLASGSIGFLVPTNAIQPGLPTLYVVPDGSEKALFAGCKTHQYPTPPWAGTKCNSSTTYAVSGPLNERTQIVPQGPFAETVTAGMQLDAKVFGANVSVGAKFNASYNICKHTKWQNADVYGCQNGVWTYLYSQHCESKDQYDSGFDPTWWVLLITQKTAIPSADQVIEPWQCYAL